MNEWAKRTWGDLELIRSRNPLIHNITNFVVMNSTANTLLCLGASPVMAHCLEEVEEMVSYARALVLNIGTLTPVWVEAMIKAGKKANTKGIPVILDPVGAGATRLRTRSAQKILTEVKIAIIRGNSAEILALAGSKVNIRGVDSLQDPEDASDTACKLACELDTVLAITGAVDIVTDGSDVHRIANGHQLMTRVTGTGCAATVVVASFAAVCHDHLRAAVEGLACFGLAGEIAGRSAGGPGSFQMKLLDALSSIDETMLASGVKVDP